MSLGVWFGITKYLRYATGVAAQVMCAHRCERQMHVELMKIDFTERFGSEAEPPLSGRLATPGSQPAAGLG